VSSATAITTVPGNHTLTVTNPVNGCRSTTVVTILKSAAIPTITASANQTLTCINTTATLTAVGTGTIVWNGGALSNATNPATVIVSGTYTATTTNTLACSGSTFVTVIQNTTTPIINNFSSALTCLAPSFRINTKFNSPGSTTIWNGPGLAANSPPTATITIAGNYTATANHNTSGCQTFSVFTITSNTITDVSTTISNSLSCANPTALLTGTSTTSGLNFYTWYPSGLSTNTLLVNAPGNYTLQVVNNTNGCPPATTVITVSGSTNSLTLSPMVTHAICGTGTVSIGIAGGAPNYTITEGLTTVATGAASSYTLTGVSVGSHTYVVSSSNSCDQTLVVTIMDLCALPVQLTKFSASCADRKATIKWTTASEINCDHFILYRSTDGIKYTRVDTINGHGNSIIKRNYQIIDNNLEIGAIYYYKLEQVDFDKTINQAGPIISSECLSVSFNYDLQPFPASNFLTIISNKTFDNATIGVYTVLGQTLITLNNVNLKDGEAFTIDVSNLAAAFYFIKIFNSNERALKKFVIGR
ncbi:MAG: T9SS type A sorting domain-containing protein, partial [Bacteroidota bacterium]